MVSKLGLNKHLIASKTGNYIVRRDVSQSLRCKKVREYFLNIASFIEQTLELNKVNIEYSMASLFKMGVKLTAFQQLSNHYRNSILERILSYYRNNRDMYNNVLKRMYIAIMLDLC